MLQTFGCVHAHAKAGRRPRGSLLEHPITSADGMLTPFGCCRARTGKGTIEAAIATAAAKAMRTANPLSSEEPTVTHS
jgi:hypothetical protein